MRRRSKWLDNKCQDSKWRQITTHEETKRTWQDNKQQDNKLSNNRRNVKKLKCAIKDESSLGNIKKVSEDKSEQALGSLFKNISCREYDSKTRFIGWSVDSPVRWSVHFGYFGIVGFTTPAKVSERHPTSLALPTLTRIKFPSIWPWLQWCHVIFYTAFLTILLS